MHNDSNLKPKLMWFKPGFHEEFILKTENNEYKDSLNSVRVNNSINKNIFEGISSIEKKINNSDINYKSVNSTYNQLSLLNDHSRNPELSSIGLENSSKSNNIQKDLTSDKDSSSYYPSATINSNDQFDSSYFESKFKSGRNIQISNSSSEMTKSQFYRQFK